MSRPPLPFDLPLERLRVTPWHDPVVEAVGHDPRSPYVERFWLALLGPSTTLLIRRFATELEAHPDGFDLDLEEVARSVGLGMRGGAGGPFLRAIARTGQFHLTKPAGPGVIATRTRIQTLTHHQVERLPASLRDEHVAWVRAAQAEPDLEQRRTRARRLALSLLELGETTEAAELQLHRWKVHPAMAHEALRWAQARRGDAPLATAAAGPPIPPPRRARPVFDPAGDAA
jgi:hypothetical protein